MNLPLSKKFLTEHFCAAEFRAEWLPIELQYHDANLWDYHKMRGLSQMTAEQRRLYIEREVE